MCYLVHWSFPLESVKDEANLICAAEGKRKLRFLSENPIWNLVEKVGARAADICLKIQFWCSSSSSRQKVQNGQLHIGKISENLWNLDLSFLSKNQKEYLNKFGQDGKDGKRMGWNDRMLGFVFLSIQKKTCWSILNTFCFHISAKVAKNGENAKSQLLHQF